jgi:hypothetical protein
MIFWQISDKLAGRAAKIGVIGGKLQIEKAPRLKDFHPRASRALPPWYRSQAGSDHGTASDALMHYPISSSMTAASWRGKRHGATKTASPRQVKGAAQGFEASQVLAAREMRRRLIASMADLASSSVGLTFTSTKAIVSAWRATISISPPRMR